MQELVDRRPNTTTRYMLPIIISENNERVQYETAMRRVNGKLKEIASIIGLRTSLTMYVARHSWASAARNMIIPMSVISESMGHESENTTRIYLTTLDNATIDEANRAIIGNL